MLRRQIFGLDISDHSVEALSLSKSLFGKPKVEAYARTLLRGEVVKDGKVKNEKKLQESIVKLLATAKPKEITSPYCIISLPESQVFTTIFKFPAGLKAKEIKNTIPYKAEEVIPFKSSEIYFDFKTIAKVDQTQEVLYVAVPIKVVDAYVQILENVGLKPVAFDLESNSLARSLIGSSRKSKDGKLIIDIGSRTTNLNIFDRNGIRQSIVIKTAGDKFTKAIARKLNITQKQAEELKAKNGFDVKQQKGKVLLVLQNEFKRIVTEAKSLIEFYQSESHRQVTEVVLVGGSSLLPKVDQYLADNLGIKVTLGEPMVGITDPNQLLKPKSKAILFSNVLGLALRGVSKDPSEDDVNLLPVSAKKFALMPRKEEKKAWKFIYIRLAIFGVLLLGFLGVYTANQRGVDLYQKVFPSASFDSSMEADFDFSELDALRGGDLDGATTTDEFLPEFEITIKQTNAGFLNVREGGGVNFAITTRVDSGGKYPMLAEDNGWYQIQVDDETAGWVSATFAIKTAIEYLEDLEEAEGEVLGVTYEEEIMEEDPDIIEPEEIVEEIIPEPEIVEPPVVVDDTVRVIVLKTSLGYLNVRSEPSTASDKVGEVFPGNEFNVLSEKNAWYQIELLNGATGWVSSVYVDKL